MIKSEFRVQSSGFRLRLLVLATVCGLIGPSSGLLAATVWVTSTGQVLFVDASDRDDLASTNSYTPVRCPDAALALEIERDLDAVRQIGVERIYDADGHDITPAPPAPKFVFVPIAPGVLHRLNADRTIRLATADERDSDKYAEFYGKLVLTSNEVAVLKGYLGADEAALFPSMTTGQRRYLTAQREIVVLLLRREIRRR